MPRLRTLFTGAYRSPLLVGLLLLAVSAGWAWQQREGFLVDEQQRMIRDALSLGSGLSILIEQLDMTQPNGFDRLQAVIDEHLELHPPIVCASVLRGDSVLAVVDDACEDALMVERPFGPFCEHPPPGTPPPLWRWHDERAPTDACPQWRVSVGVMRDYPPHIVSAANRRFMTVLILSWLAIGALLAVWIRSIKTRSLVAALDAERRERSVLSDMNLAGAGLAHETKNPLGIIFGLAQRLAQDADASPRQHEIAEQIIDEADRATARLGEFIQFARVPEPVMAPTRLDTLIDSVLAVLQADFDDRQVRVRREGDACTIRCDAAMIQQLIVNLVLNGVQASNAGGQMTIGVKQQGNTAALTVSDDGRGVPANLRADIFKPYVTGRADGHGLGLAIVKRIVDQHRWTIGITDRVPTGTVVRVEGLEVLEGSAA